MIRKYSRRQDQIIKVARIKAPKGRAAIAALTRERKNNDWKQDKLFDEWLKRLSPNEYKLAGSATRRAMASGAVCPEPLNEEHLASALERLMDAYSRVSEEQLLTASLKQGVGEVTLDGLQEALEATEAVKAEVNGVAMVQSWENRQKEAELLRFARKGGIVWITGKPTDAAKREAEQRDAIWVKDAGKQSFAEIHRLSQVAESEGKTLVLQGLAPKSAPEGHALNVLREVAGLAPLDETGRKKSRNVVSGALKGVAERMKHRMDVMLRLEWMRQQQPEVDGGISQRQAARTYDRGIEL